MIKDCIVDAKSKIMLCDKKEQINEIYDETISKINQIEKSENKFNILNFKFHLNFLIITKILYLNLNLIFLLKI